MSKTYDFFSMGYNAALNEVPSWRAVPRELALVGSKAREGGSKLRLATCSGTFWPKGPVKDGKNV
jgi:hypothetical protein